MEKIWRVGNIEQNDVLFHSVMRVAVMDWASQGRSQGVNETPVLLPTGFYEVAKLPGVVAAVLSAIWRTFCFWFFTGESQWLPLAGWADIKFVVIINIWLLISCCVRVWVRHNQLTTVGHESVHCVDEFGPWLTTHWVFPNTHTFVLWIWQLVYWHDVFLFLANVFK